MSIHPLRAHGTRASGTSTARRKLTVLMVSALTAVGLMLSQAAPASAATVSEGGVYLGGHTCASNVNGYSGCTDDFHYPTSVTSVAGATRTWSGATLWHWQSGQWVRYQVTGAYLTSSWLSGGTLYYLYWGGMESRVATFSYSPGSGSYEYTWSTYWYNSAGQQIASYSNQSNVFAP